MSQVFQTCELSLSGLWAKSFKPVSLVFQVYERAVATPRVRSRDPESAHSRPRERAVVTPRVRTRNPESAQSQPQKCALADTMNLSGSIEKNEKCCKTAVIAVTAVIPTVIQAYKP